MKKEIKYSLIFIVIVLVVSWILTMIIFSQPETIQLFPLIMFVPALAGITLNSIRYKSLKLVFNPLTTKINFKSILFSLLYPVVFIALIAIVVSLTGIGTLNKEKLSGLTGLPSLGVVISGFILMFAEEYGWRGFLLKELAAAKGEIFSAIIVGIVWALWHAPVVYSLADYAQMENPLLIMVIQMGAVFVFSVPFAYSYFLANNIFPPMLFHFVWNFYNPMILGDIYGHEFGVIEGNLILINGEGLAGIILGLPFIIWYIYNYRKSRKN